MQLLSGEASTSPARLSQRLRLGKRPADAKAPASDGKLGLAGLAALKLRKNDDASPQQTSGTSSLDWNALTSDLASRQQTKMRWSLTQRSHAASVEAIKRRPLNEESVVDLIGGPRRRRRSFMEDALAKGSEEVRKHYQIANISAFRARVESERYHSCLVERVTVIE